MADEVIGDRPPPRRSPNSAHRGAKYTKGKRRRSNGAGGIKTTRVTELMVERYWPTRRRVRFLFLWKGYRDWRDIQREINLIPAPDPVTFPMMRLVASHCRVRRPRSLPFVDRVRREMARRQIAAGVEPNPDATYAIRAAIRAAREIDRRLPKPSRKRKPPAKAVPKIRVIRMGKPPRRRPKFATDKKNPRNRT